MENEWIEVMVKKHEREKTISRVVSIESVNAVGKGENYNSTILRTKLDVVLESGKKTSRYVIIKRLPETETHRKIVTNLRVFHKEINMYTNTLKHLETLMEDYRDPDPKLWCELIGYRSYDIIILEDLKDLNFKVANRVEMLDLDHSLVAIRGLAKYHAMTKVALREGYNTKGDFTPYVFTSDATALEMLVKGMMTTMVETVTNEWGPDWEEHVQKLNDLKETAVEKLLEIGTVDESRFNVINHGDYWTNNVLFKYDGYKKPTAVKLVDFQMAHYNSFGIDLTYFLYNSVRADIRRENMKDLIQAYYDSLKEKLLAYDTPEEDIPSMEEIESEMTRLSTFGLILICSMAALMMAEGGGGIDFEKNADDPSDDSIGVNNAIYNSPKYKEMFQQDLIEFANLGIL